MLDPFSRREAQPEWIKLRKGYLFFIVPDETTPAQTDGANPAVSNRDSRIATARPLDHRAAV